MLVSVSTVGRELILRLGGSLGAASLVDLQPALIGLESRKFTSIVLDLAALRHIDAAGVGAIASLHGLAQAVGGSLVVRNAQEQPMAVFRMFKVDGAFVHAHERQRVASFRITRELGESRAHDDRLRLSA